MEDESLAQQGMQRVTTITPVPQTLSIGLPETWNMKHIYTASKWMSWNIDDSTAGGTTDPSQDFELKLNTIYDVDPGVTGNQQPTWRTFMANMYDYYTVLKCEIHLNFTAYGVTASNVAEQTERSIGFEGNPSEWIILYRDFGATKYSSFTADYNTLLLDPNLKAIDMNLYYNGNSLEITTPAIQRSNYRGKCSINLSFTHADYMKLTDIVQDGNDKIWVPVG